MIYFIWRSRDAIFLLDLHLKSDKEDLTDADEKDIRRFLATLQAEA